MTKENITCNDLFSTEINDDQIGSMLGSIAILPTMAVGATLIAGVNWLTNSIKNLMND